MDSVTALSAHDLGLHPYINRKNFRMHEHPRRGEVVDRLLPAVPEINTLGGAFMSRTDWKFGAGGCRVEERDSGRSL